MNRQRGFIPVSLIVYGIIAVVVLAAIGGAVYSVRHWCNDACKNAQAETAKAIARADAAEAREAAARAEKERVTRAWAAESVAAQLAAAQAEGERNARFVPVESAARGLPAAVARAAFPTDAARVLERAVDTANHAIARPAAEPPEAATAAPAAAAGAFDVEGVTTWGVACAKGYAELAAQVTGWIAFYGRLQAAQLTEAIH